MRTLVDLLSDERGYVRIFAGPDGYGYEQATYAPRSIADLFETMSGFPSLSEACEAASYQLSSTRSVRRPRRRSKSARHSLRVKP